MWGGGWGLFNSEVDGDNFSTIVALFSLSLSLPPLSRSFLG